LLAGLVASPIFADPYVQCVETQLSQLGYLAAPADTCLDGASRAAAEAFRTADPARARGVAFLPPLSRKTAVDWCRDLAAADPKLRAY